MFKIFVQSSVLLILGALNVAAEIKVACNVPLTGGLATYGAAIREGVDFALSELSEGPPVSFDWEDNRGDPREAITLWRQQSTIVPDIYISGVRPQTTVIRHDITRRQVPHFMWVFDVDVRSSSEPNNFRMWVNFKAETPLFLEYADRIKAKRVAILYVQLGSTDEAYGRRLATALRENGIELLVEPFSIDLMDFNTLALRVQSFNPDLLILNGFQTNLLPMIRTLRNLRLIRPGNTVATYDLLDAAPMLSPNELEGIRTSAPRFVIYREKDSEIAAWYERFRQRYGRDPLYTHAFAYDMARVIIDAAKRWSPQSSTTLLETIQSTQLEGITGPLTFDSQGDLPPSVELGIYKNGVLQPEE